MNKIKKFFRAQPSIAALATAICSILTFGIGWSIAVLLYTTRESHLFQLPFCLSDECAKWYFSQIGESLAIAHTTLDFSVSIATIGGIFVALLSYLNTSGNAALANHIEHLKLFSEYLETEIKKRDRLSANLIDALLLYGKIFNQSRNGKTSVSDEYISFIKRLNVKIEESNKRCVVGTPGGFSHNDHQRKIKDHMQEIGVTIYMAPRNDYFEMEDQLFSLLHRISQSFCPPGSVSNIITRKYY